FSPPWHVPLLGVDGILPAVGGLLTQRLPLGGFQRDGAGDDLGHPRLTNLVGQAALLDVAGSVAGHFDQRAQGGGGQAEDQQRDEHLQQRGAAAGGGGAAGH